MGQAAIFAGAFVKLLKDQILLGSTARILTGTTNPTITAILAERGSLYMLCDPTGANPAQLFQKIDAGLSTNWRAIQLVDDFSFSSITGSVVTVRGGAMYLSDGRILSTYSGAGSTSTSFHVDITFDLSVLVPLPSNPQYYTVCIDLTTLGAPIVQTDTGLSAYPITAANFIAFAATPETLNLLNYAPIGYAKYTGTWSVIGDIEHNRMPSPLKTISPLTFSFGPQTIGSVGSSGQIAGAHLLARQSFPSSLASNNLTFWNLDTSFLDKSGNTRTLSSAGNFTGTDEFGVSNNAFTGSYTYLTNAAFTPGPAFTTGGWFYNTNWASATNVGIMGVGTTNDYSWEVSVNSGSLSLALCATGDAGTSYTKTQSLSLAGVTSSWFHLAVAFDGNSLDLCIDGVLKISILTSSIRTPATTRLFFNTSPFYQLSQLSFGVVRDCFFITGGALTVDQIRKTSAYKITHGRNVTGDVQWWIANWYSPDGSMQEPLTQDWLVDKSDPNTVYLRFRGMGATDQVSLKLFDVGITSFNVLSPRSYDSGWLSAVPSFPLAHKLPDVPSSVSLMYEQSPGGFTLLSVLDYLSWDATNFVGDTAALALIGVSPTKRIRIIASVGNSNPIAFGNASLVANGLVSFSDQHLGGNKWLNGNFNPEADNTFTLGTALLRWASLHVGPGSLVVHSDATNTKKMSIDFDGSMIRFGSDASTPMEWSIGGTQIGLVGTNGAWTLGPAAGNVTHVIQGKVQATQGITGMGSSPVGTIMAWLPGYFTGVANAGYTNVLPTANTEAAANTYLNPIGWWVCDGSAVNDAASSIWNAAGRFLPDLNDDRFLQAGIDGAAGVSGGANVLADHLHSVSGSVGGADGTHTHGDNGHTHSYFDTTQGLSTTNGSNPGPAAGFSVARSGTLNGNPILNGYASINSSGSAHGHGFSLSAGSGTNPSSGTLENRPKYLKVFYIVRVK